MAKRESWWVRNYDYDYMAGSVYKPPNYNAEFSERLPNYVLAVLVGAIVIFALAGLIFEACGG